MPDRVDTFRGDEPLLFKRISKTIFAGLDFGPPLRNVALFQVIGVPASAGAALEAAVLEGLRFC